MENRYSERIQITAVTQTPYIIEENGKYKSETIISVQNPEEAFEGWIEIEEEQKPPYRQPVGRILPGEREVTVDVDELEKDGAVVSFRLYRAGESKAAAEISLPQKKVRHWKVYVSHSFHMDIGYTDSQEHLIRKKWPEHLDEALQFAEDTDEWEKAIKFRHHVESSFLLYGSAMQVRDADWIEKLKERLKEERIAFSASCMNSSMEVMSTEQLIRYYYYSARHLKDMLGADSSGIAMMVDNPSISWAGIDIMAQAGVKAMYLGPNFNWKTPKTVTDRYPRLFYMKGRNPENKVLILSGTLYNLDEMQFVDDGPKPEFVPLEMTVKCTANALMNRYHTEDYPCDAVVQMVDQYWDNGALFPGVMNRVREMSERRDAQGRPYIYPKFINSNMKDFCSYVEENYGSEIAGYSGTFENWWCYGTPSDAYSAAQVREAHDLLPAAEALSVAASCLIAQQKYPHREIAEAYHDMILYDEHTFGPGDSSMGEQHIWKRNTAIASRRMAEELVEKAGGALGRLIPAKEQTVAVYNPLSWKRDDIVKISVAGLPEHFELVDTISENTVAFRRGEEGQIEFKAEGIPALGYKCYEIREVEEEAQPAQNRKTEPGILENRFYKITLDQRGAVCSIIDKQNGGIELVDKEAPYAMNEFVYMTSNSHDFELRSVSRTHDAQITIRADAVSGAAVTRAVCEGTAGIRQEIILYDEIARIDFLNTVYKNDALAWGKQDEEGFFVFPLNVPDFELRHEMPSGDVRPYVEERHAAPDEECDDIEQFYTSSTDFYTVNRWIDASSKSGNYGVMLSSMSAPIVQYGERRTLLYDVDYNTKKPWIYSYALNNKWGTNFMRTQPGILTFRYSLQSHGGNGWRNGRADHFGWEQSVPLLAAVLPKGQPGKGLPEKTGQWLALDTDHVALTAAKISEANGEGVILRFNETLGRDTDVTADLSFFHPVKVTETDLVENDRCPAVLEDGKLRFSIDAYGYKTFRVCFGEAPETVRDVSAVICGDGTWISWSESGNQTAFYEIFRDRKEDFVPGTGTYVGSTCNTEFLDRQVTEQVSAPYFYKVRESGCGRKGAASEAVKARKGERSRKTVLEAPTGLRADIAFGSRVSLSWSYPADTADLDGFYLYRDGARIADLSPIHRSFLDMDVIPGSRETYCVQAYGKEGIVSEKSDLVDVVTAKGMIKPGNIAPQASISASSQMDTHTPVTAAADGLNGITGQWVSAGEKTPWICLDWEEEHTIDKVVFYDRDTGEGMIKSGVFLFSDGSCVETGKVTDGVFGKTVSFPARTVRWVKFQVTESKGVNIGLAEIEVYEVRA